MAVVLHHSRAKGTTKLVLLGIANHQGDGGSWPTRSTLAKYANVTPDAVRKCIRTLRSLGELAVDVQEGGDRDCPDDLRPNLYHVLVSCPPWCDRSPNHRDTRKLAGRQPGLWINRGADSPPGPPRPRDRGATSPPKPSPSQPPHQVVPQPQDTRPCCECGQLPARCQLLQVTWPTEDRHPYAPA